MNYGILYYKNRNILLNQGIDVNKQTVFLPGNRTLEEYMEI